MVKNRYNSLLKKIKNIEAANRKVSSKLPWEGELLEALSKIHFT
jgi:hypothetical protein